MRLLLETAKLYAMPAPVSASRFAQLVSLVLLGVSACTTDPETISPHTLQSPQIDSLYALAITQIRQGQIDSATALLQQVLASNSSHYEACLGLGEISMRQQRHEDALRYFQRALSIDPDRPEARMQLARTLVELERNEQAIQVLEALAIDIPAHVGIRMLLADLLMTRKPPDPAGALAHYEEALASRPDYRPARAGAAASRLRVGELERSAGELEELVQEEPLDVALTFFLGTAQYRQGKYRAAVESFQAAIDALPQNSPRLTVRRWNLRIAYLAAYSNYPGDLPKRYQMQMSPVAKRSPVRFTDVAETAGVGKVDRGRGSVWSDFDGDGSLDLFTVGIHVRHALYQGNGVGGFSEVTEDVGVLDHRGGWSSTAADYDNDGDADLYVTRDAWEGRGPNSLYRNDHTIGNSLRFTDAAQSAGILDPDDSFHAAWADVDNDGWVDLYVADGITGTGAANKLFINRKDGSFEDRAKEMGAAVAGKTLGVAFGDYDADGDIDLYSTLR